MFTQLNFNTPKNLVNSKIIIFKRLPHYVFKNFWLVSVRLENLPKHGSLFFGNNY